MTKQEAINKLPTSVEAMKTAKEIYKHSSNREDKVQAFIDGVNHAKLKLSEPIKKPS